METKMIQLELFERTPEEKMIQEMKTLKDSMDKVRKSQFAKIGELRKLVDEVKFELENFKKSVCTNSFS